MSAKSRKKGRASRGPTGSGDTTIAFWLVAFLDMLGYRATLQKFDVYPLPTEPGDQDAFRQRFVHAVHLRRRLLGAIREFQFSTRRETPLPAELPPQARPTAERWGKAKLLNMPGPDHVVLACSLTGDVDHFPLRGVYNTVAAACAAMLIQLALGADDHEQSLPLRGGIDIGPGALLHPENFLYSPALTRAYDLESKAAVYPRTLAGDRFLGYLRAYSEDHGTDPTTHYNRALADRVLSMFFRDHDGKTALDFLGAPFRENLPDELALDLATKARQFVRRGQAAAKIGGDQRLIAKYDWLVNYVEPRVEVWGVRS
ncbi:MAG: hypothetical protein SFV15_21605 [Polyangiaceae bacterium]|nr:hypothetical protein [Polyangiaceae bacterium]